MLPVPVRHQCTEGSGFFLLDVPHKFHQNSSFVLQVRNESLRVIKTARVRVCVCECVNVRGDSSTTGLVERFQVGLHARTLSSGRPHTQTKRRHRSAEGGDAAASSHSCPAPIAPHRSSPLLAAPPHIDSVLLRA